jgi:hypothetical protein
LGDSADGAPGAAAEDDGRAAADGTLAVVVGGEAWGLGDGGDGGAAAQGAEAVIADEGLFPGGDERGGVEEAAVGSGSGGEAAEEIGLAQGASGAAQAADDFVNGEKGRGGHGFGVRGTGFCSMSPRAAS